jgi:hypothetical protein
MTTTTTTTTMMPGTPLGPPPPAMQNQPPMDYFDRVTRQAEIDRTMGNTATTAFGHPSNGLPFHAGCQPPVPPAGGGGDAMDPPGPTISTDGGAGGPNLWASRHCTEDGPMSGFGRYVNRAAPGLCGSLETLGDPRLWNFGGIESLDLVYKGSDAELSKGSAANRPAPAAPPASSAKGKAAADDESVGMLISPESEAIEVERILTEERDVVGAATGSGSRLDLGSRVPSIVKSFTDASMVSVVSAVKQGGRAPCSPGGACASAEDGNGKFLGSCGCVGKGTDEQEGGGGRCGRDDQLLNCSALEAVDLDEIQRNLVQFGRNVMSGGHLGDHASDDDGQEGGCGGAGTDHDDYDGDEDEEDDDDYDMTSREASTQR